MRAAVRCHSRHWHIIPSNISIYVAIEIFIIRVYKVSATNRNVFPKQQTAHTRTVRTYRLALANVLRMVFALTNSK